MAAIRVVNSVTEFETLLNGTKSPVSLLVVDFWATWCGPCRAIAPVVENLAKQFPHAIFAKVDVDAQVQIARTYQITAMPTFKLFKDGNEVDSLRGADPRALEAKIRQHYVVPESTEQGSTSGATSPVGSVNGYPDITFNVDPNNA